MPNTSFTFGQFAESNISVQPKFKISVLIYIIHKYFVQVCIFQNMYSEYTSITYMIHQVTMFLHHDMYIQYKGLYWRSLHSNHLHHSYILQCWLHRHKTHLQSMLEEHHNSDLRSRCIPCNIVY